MKTYIPAVIVGLIAVFSGVYVYTNNIKGDERTACTQEAKLCSDGSAVGRTGPRCEFSECPTISPVATVSDITLAVGQSGVVQTLRITVNSVVQDSRCPIDVTCIQAGSVTVNTTVTNGMTTITKNLSSAGAPEIVGGYALSITAVEPAKTSKKETLPAEYRITFHAEKVVPAPAPVPKIIPTTSGVRGVVSLGPTCPVMRDPPDPSCADKPYATTIVARRTGGNALVATGTSDEEGAFSLALSPGAYVLSAGDGKMFPRCSETSVVISQNTYTAVTISCDTGIR